jgi:Type IV pilus assembly protein PilM
MTRLCAIDLGSRELKLVEADGNRLSHHAEVLLPEGALIDGIPTPLLTAAVRGALEAGGFTATRARVAIGETGTAFRDFRLPALRHSDLSEAVMFEGRRQVPMAAADVYFAWHAVKDARGYAVYLVAARRGMIDGLLEAVGAAGLQVELMDLKPLALSRGMGVTDGLLLEWGGTEATLVLMAQGRPRFFRTFVLDAPAEDVGAQLDELSLSLNALVKFARGSSPDIAITPATTLALGGRFAFLPDGQEQARQRFDFAIALPTLGFRVSPDFPWQAHFAGLGLLQQRRWRNRLSPSQGGDIRVAA